MSRDGMDATIAQQSRCECQLDILFGECVLCVVRLLSECAPVASATACEVEVGMMAPHVQG
eukprot:4431169-Pyramimonas_sp.AAC.1